MKGKIKIVLELMYVFLISLLFLRIFLIFYRPSIESLEAFLNYFFSDRYDGMGLHSEYPIRFYRRLAFSVVVTFVLTMAYFRWIKYLFRRKPYWLIVFLIFPLALILINLTPIGYVYAEFIRCMLEAGFLC